MAEFESCIGESDEWYTPQDYFQSFRCEFDLDPCSPGPDHWVPAKEIHTIEDDGLSKDWGGKFVFMNPPFGGRNGHLPWLDKWIVNDNGIAVVRAYTSSKWFHDYIYQVDSMLFPKGKTKFVRPDGNVGKSPGHGIILLGLGWKANQVLMDCGLGFFMMINHREKA